MPSESAAKIVVFDDFPPALTGSVAETCTSAGSLTA